jgi:hypothetical protein
VRTFVPPFIPISGVALQQAPQVIGASANVARATRMRRSHGQGQAK